LNKYLAGRNISIVNISMLTFIVLLLITVSAIGIIVLSNWGQSVKRMTLELAGKMNQDIVEQIHSFIRVPVDLNNMNYRIIENGILDLSDQDARDRFFVGVLSACDKAIYSFSYCTVDGKYYGARRNEDGVVQIVKNDAKAGGGIRYYSVNEDMTAGSLAVNAGKFDPGMGVWYKAAAESGKASFSPVYKHSVVDDLSFSAAQPVFDDKGTLMGVLGTHVLLSDIEAYFEDIVRSNHGYAVIVEKETGYLIANSLGARNFTVSDDGTLDRKTPDSIESAAIREGYHRYIDTHEQNFAIKDGAGDLIMNFHEYKQPGLDWLIISAVPESVQAQEVYRNTWITISLAVVSLLVLFAAYYVITRKLVRPLNALLRDMRQFSSGDLSRRAAVKRMDEIGSVAEVFNSVAEKTQQLINSLASRTEELHRTNESLEQSRERMRRILDATAEAIYGTDLDGVCIFCNKSCLVLLGYNSQEELLGKNMHRLIHHSRKDGTPIREDECAIFRAMYRGEGVHSSEEVFWKADGTPFDAEYRAVPIFRSGQIVGTVVTFTDISERKKDEEQIRFLSSHDYLTGLMNRRCFEEEMEKQDREENLPISVLFIDLDSLKMMNDTFGHAFGDELITKAAAVLKRNCRDGDIVARIGGDEFVILLPRTGAAGAEKIAGRLKAEFSQEKIHSMTCSMSLGIGTKSEPGQKIEAVLEAAEFRMYREKAILGKRLDADAIRSMMGALHEKSPREKRLSEEVGRLCGEIGLEMGLTETAIKKLREAGYLHNIGKVSLNEALLNKDPQTLTGKEEEMLQKHPAVGYRILILSEDTQELAAAVHAHHERWDGSGYPQGLKGEEIPLFARIIAVAETWATAQDGDGDAEAGREKALKAIAAGAGQGFDPQIAGLFMDRMKRQG